MNYSQLVQRIADDGAAAWNIHFDALAAQARGEDVIVLSVGDPDLATPPEVVESAVRGLRAGDTHYTALTGEPALRTAIAADFRNAGGWAADPENVCVVAGAQTGLYFAALLLTGPGDEVLVLEPCYVTYDATIRASGAEPVAVPPAPRPGFRPDPAAIEAAITPRTKAIMFANPNNPTGTVMTPDELAGIAEIAQRHDLWVISDEVYAPLCFERGHTPVAGLAGMADRAVTVSSLSKSHAMTGWRVGWLIGPRQMIEHAQNLALVMVYGLPGFIQRAAVSAFEEADRIIPEMRQVYRDRRDLMLAALAEAPDIQALQPEAGMFLMVDVRDTGIDSATFARRLLQEQGVSVLDANAFGRGGEGFVRLSYVCSEDQLARACRRIVAFCHALAGREHAHG
jgi:aspartate/methionine/tyrosine aminotransferase